METSSQTSRCRPVSIASAATVQSTSALALLHRQRAINLAELARSIRANRNLCYLVTEAACREFGFPWLNVEEAIVLLGRKRLSSLLAEPNPRGRTASQLRRVLHSNRTAPSANLCLLEASQGKLK